MNKKEIQEQKQYQQKVEEMAPKSPIVMDCLKAFLVGGIICVIGQGVSDFGRIVLELTGDAVGAFTSIVMVFLGATLTGIGVYDKIGQFGGAGSAVPITGFANSIVSPAMEFRREGVVMGIGAKLFSIAGPVLVYGVGGSIIVGLIWRMLH